jgi:uncharacterized damage-inducible protein DinB
MDKNDLQMLFAYNRWANERVLAACRALTPAQMQAPAQCSFGSLIGDLVHIYGAEHVWRVRMQEGASPGALPTAAEFAALEGLEALWSEEQQRMRVFVDGLTADDPNRWVEYKTTTGQMQGSTLWKALAQVAFHGVQFRAEAGAVLGALGHSPGDLDLILYLREVDQR